MKNLYRDISGQSYKMNNELIGDEQGRFRSGRECVDKTFTLNQMREKVLKKLRVYMCFMDLEKA